MDPTAKYNGLSFWDVQLKPIADAVNANLDRGARFLVNLEGEMGTRCALFIYGRCSARGDWGAWGVQGVFFASRANTHPTRPISLPLTHPKHPCLRLTNPPTNTNNTKTNSLFGYPKEYSQLKDWVKGAATKGKEWHAPKVQVGAKVNFDQVAGAAEKLPRGLDRNAARDLVRALDFVAISAYAALPDPSNVRPADFQRSAAEVDKELRWYGIDFLKEKKL